ncbi:MAG TPA: twin-arginine translocase TatA/TatE family subunit [Geminicoccaceae bacterium]|nr:twin-arginine translocase TatA/TatE family subunit [Geminicoccus sp.]HMU52435.1 twin-arginine translocase TatA/TatE family subunit [Geminicoccaceae bacterium]
MSIGVWQVVLILLIVVILFGAGKLPRVMGDVAKGIKTFKAGMKDEIAGADSPPAEEVKRPDPAAARTDENVRG